MLTASLSGGGKLNPAQASTGRKKKPKLTLIEREQDTKKGVPDTGIVVDVDIAKAILDGEVDTITDATSHDIGGQTLLLVSAQKARHHHARRRWYFSGV